MLTSTSPPSHVHTHAFGPLNRALKFTPNIKHNITSHCITLLHDCSPLLGIAEYLVDIGAAALYRQAALPYASSCGSNSKNKNKNKNKSSLLIQGLGEVFPGRTELLSTVLGRQLDGPVLMENADAFPGSSSSSSSTSESPSVAQGSGTGTGTKQRAKGYAQARGSAFASACVRARCVRTHHHPCAS